MAPADEPSIRVELGAIADAAGLRRQVFDHPAFVSWKQGRSGLTLFLDSLDEGLLSVDNVGVVLRSHLRGGPGERLRVRVTCRAADWPEGLGRSLRDILGEEHAQTLTLAPLRASDAEAIARSELGDQVEAFFEEVHRADVRALTALPLSLQLLLRVFKARGHLPDRPADLFEQASLDLCEEQNDDRVDAQRTGTLDRNDRLDLATRVAGLLRLSGKTHLYLGRAALQSPDALIPEDLQSPSESPPVSVDPASVRDLVRHAGLFEPVGSQAYRFSHAAFGEYLAARFLHRQGVPPDAALSLLSHPDSGLLPQHRQTAGWLAALDPRFFDALAEAEPDTALLYVPDPPSDQRLALLRALIKAADQGALDPFSLDPRLLSRLHHEDVERELRAVIEDDRRSEHARRLAIWAALDLRLNALVPNLVRVALDREAPARVRRIAVRAVEELGAEDDRTARGPLAQTARREDPGRDIAVAARRALFPGVLSVRDLIKLARQDAAADERARTTGEQPPPPPVDAGVMGSMMGNPHAQLLHDVLSRTVADLPSSLLRDALFDLASIPGPDSFEHQAATALAERAADRLPDDDLAPALADLLLGHEDIDTPLRRRLPRVVPGVRRATADDDRKRRAIVIAMVHEVADEVERGLHDEHVFSLQERLAVVTSDRQLLSYDTAEVEWLIEQLRAERAPEVRRVWAALVQDAARFANRELWEPVLTACLAGPWTPELLGIYLDRFAAWDVDGPDADAARESQRWWDEKVEEREVKRVPHDPPLPRQVDLLLADGSLGAVEKLDRMLDLLDLDPEDARFSSHHMMLNPTGSALWKVLTDTQREGLIALAEDVLRTVRVPLEEALVTDGRIYTRTRVALEAVALLAQTGRFDPSPIPDEAIVGIAVAHLAHSNSSVNEVSRARDDLRDAAWKRRREDFVAAVAAVARKPEHAYTLLVHLLPLWDAALDEPFVESARARPIGPHPSSLAYGREHMLDRLMGLGVDAAVDVVLEEIAPLVDPKAAPVMFEGESEQDAISRMVWRSTVAFLLAPERTWALLRPWFESDDGFVRRWLRAMASRLHDRHQDWPDVSATLTGYIYRRLHKLLPPSEDIQRPSGVSYTPTAQDNLSDFRWTLIGALTSRATVEDVEEVRSLHTELPDAGLTRAVANAERQHRRLNLSYPSPDEILRLIATSLTMPDKLALFISHSSADEDLARDIADFLRIALRLQFEEVRCTTVPGYKLAGGVHTETVLKREVHEAGVVVGLLSKASLDSLYVAFELGARWGVGKPLFPLFAPGFDASDLRGPLSATNGLRADVAADLHQLVRDISRKLDCEKEDASAYQRNLDAVLAHAGDANRASASENVQKSPKQKVPANESTDPKRDVSADDFADAEQIIREHCEAKHGDDYSLLDYCIRQQSEAVEDLKQGAPSHIPNEVFAKIRARFAREHPTDYEMRRYLEKQEFDAYRRTRS